MVKRLDNRAHTFRAALFMAGAKQKVIGHMVISHCCTNFHKITGFGVPYL